LRRSRILLLTIASERIAFKQRSVFSCDEGLRSNDARVSSLTWISLRPFTTTLPKRSRIVGCDSLPRLLNYIFGRASPRLSRPAGNVVRALAAHNWRAVQARSRGSLHPASNRATSAQARGLPGGWRVRHPEHSGNQDNSVIEHPRPTRKPERSSAAR
jgi:hypothetical protein